MRALCLQMDYENMSKGIEMSLKRELYVVDIQHMLKHYRQVSLKIFVYQALIFLQRGSSWLGIFKELKIENRERFLRSLHYSEEDMEILGLLMRCVKERTRDKLVVGQVFEDISKICQRYVINWDSLLCLWR